MKKRLLSVLLLFIMLCEGVTAFAFDSKALYTELRYFRAKIYVCDTKNQEAILVNVNMQNGLSNPELTKDIEYTAIPIASETVFSLKGEKLSLEFVNEYLLDSTVRVLVGKNGYGYKILSMNFFK